jgi:hypothetical protein
MRERYWMMATAWASDGDAVGELEGAIDAAGDEEGVDEDEGGT